MFQDQDSAMSILRARPLVPTSPAARAALRSAPGARSPQFLVLWGGKGSGWWGSLGALCTRVHGSVHKESVVLFRSTPVAPFRFPGGSVTASVLLHLVAILVLPFLLALPPGRDITSVAAYSEPEKIYYRLTTHDPFEKLPRIAPAGLGGHPGAGSSALRLPILGSTAAHQRIIIVSKPVRPDNHRQTIYQPATPPDLKITMDLKLPNVIGGTSATIAKPQIHFNPKDSKPTQVQKAIAKAMAPSLPNTATPSSLPEPTVSQPHLAVPIDANNSRPAQWQGVRTMAAAPTLAAPSATSSSSNLGDSPNSPARPAEVIAVGEISGDGRIVPPSNSGAPAAGDGSGVVVISVDPSQAAALLNLPPGNRLGDFSIAPGGGQPGSPGGATTGSASVGGGGIGPGGDRSTGVGPGESGGGGGKASPPGTLSISGNTGGKGAGMLDPSIVRDMVYAVPASLVLRRNALIVSAGPMGGGGLDAYGALHCGKIYTVFLAMPGKGWTLQFCQSGNSAAKPAVQTNSGVVHMESGLLPPDAESRFDFRRLPVPFEKKNKMIVLRGAIKEDGTVDALQVYQSIVPEMDEAARVAFSRWKFKPAMREGKAVAVDILVGVPTEPPPNRPQ
jgi:Gram-negative bacterial TonB protein C-terminal